MTAPRWEPDGGVTAPRRSVTVGRLVVGGRPLVAKRATGGARRRLRREAELLDHLHDLPVVQVVALRDSDDHTDLVTVDAGNRDLADPAGRTPEELLRALAATASAVAALHAAGWTHGAICCEHVVLDDEGDVALCSLGSARPCALSDDDIQLDVAQLTALLHRVGLHRDTSWSASQIREWRRSTRRLHHRLRRLDATIASTDGTSPTAADIAAALQELSIERHATSPRRRTGRVRPHQLLSGTPSALLAGALGVGVTALLWSAVTPAGGAPTPAIEKVAVPQEADDCEDARSSADLDVDGDGCTERVEIDGNLLRVAGTTVRAGRDGDQVVVASLDCTSTARVLLYRPTTGELFAFDDWPSDGRPASAQLLWTSANGGALRTTTRLGCRTAELHHAGGATIPVGTDAPEEPPIVEDSP